MVWQWGRQQWQQMAAARRRRVAAARAPQAVPTPLETAERPLLTYPPHRNAVPVPRTRRRAALRPATIAVSVIASSRRWMAAKTAWR